MIISGSYVIDNIISDVEKYIPIYIENPDPHNDLIRTSQVQYNVVCSGELNGKLIFYNVVYSDQGLLGFEVHQLEKNVINGKIDGDQLEFNCELSTQITKQQAWSLIKYIRNDGEENSGSITVNHQAIYKYPVELPSNYFLYIVDNETNYRRPILEIRPYDPDEKIIVGS